MSGDVGAEACSLVWSGSELTSDLLCPSIPGSHGFVVRYDPPGDVLTMRKLGRAFLMVLGLYGVVGAIGTVIVRLL